MKLRFFNLLTILLVTSCSEGAKEAESADLSARDFPQKWVLVKMTGNMANSETTGDDMTWQEFYLLQEDGSFMKSRTQEAVTKTAEGRYEWEELSEEKYLVLNYDHTSEIIGSCNSKSREHLMITPEGILQSSWMACDGPGLFYSREK